MNNLNYKILIIGLGSIGRRHYDNLRKLGYSQVYVHDTDQKRIENYELKIKRLNQKAFADFNVVFVCSPNHLHVKHALLAARAGCHVFIEKPLSHNLQDTEQLQKLVRSKKLTSLVACNMRFHPALSFIKNYLAKKRLGKIYSISCSFGYYLPYWRRTDYRKNFAAKRSTGGGVILDDIHEYDLLFWLNDFAPLVDSNIISGHASDLQIETEDIAVGTFKFKNKVIGLVKSDYLNQSYTRRCQIVGQKGTVEWDFKENIVWFLNRSGRRKIFAPKEFDFNNVYLDEVKYFFDCLKKRKPAFNDIGRANLVLKAVLANAR